MCFSVWIHPCSSGFARRWTAPFIPAAEAGQAA
jgi:hypothetical protein